MQAQSTEFAIVPDLEDIEKLDRTIQFFPSDSRAATTLTTDQVERFNRDGYLSPLDVFAADEIRRYREFFDRVLADALAQGKDSYSISSAHLKHPEAWELLCNPRIVAYVRDLLGPDVVGWGSHFFCKLPRDGKRVDWHQDCSYWPLTPTKTVTVWLAIDDADEENGCMEVVAGSHRFELIEFDQSDSGSGNVLNQTVRDPERYGEIRRTPVSAGQVSIHSDLLLHGSPPNDSARRRCGLTLRYCPADVQAHLGWNAKGVVVAGTADPALWPGAKRP